MGEEQREFLGKVKEHLVNEEEIMSSQQELIKEGESYFGFFKSEWMVVHKELDLEQDRMQVLEEEQMEKA